jgi:predicted nucleotidyltransferase
MARIDKSHEELIRLTPFMWPDALIHLFVGGSGMHGGTGHKPSDLDLMGVYIQPIELVLGITQMTTDDKGLKHVFQPDVQVWTTSNDNVKNNADDVDLNLFSLRKWSSMAATGNTNALEFLFVPNTAWSAGNAAIWNEFIAPNAQHFISKRAAFHFSEFSKGMLKRLKGGEGTGKHGQRPDLIEEFGYDTKAAMHLIRVLEEGRELMDTGKITLPRPNAQLLKRIRSGEFDWVEIEFMYDNRQAALFAAQENSNLPAELDRAKISSIITAAQLEFWGYGDR